jgi:hypothetical protein
VAIRVNRRGHGARLDSLGSQAHARSRRRDCKEKQPFFFLNLLTLNQPKLWNELQAGIECLTQLLLLIDTMSRTTIADPTLAESADLLQQQIVYNGDILDLAVDSLRGYRQGSQSLAYLNASIHLAYTLMRVLERWLKGKGDGVYVRRKTVRRQKKSRGIFLISQDDGGDINWLQRKKVSPMPKMKKKWQRNTTISFEKPCLPLIRLKW